jgi:NDP-sugar pyrophosphorylase family protein
MMDQPTTIAITMAGFGSRFRDAGYDCPKYMISVRGDTLFGWSLRGLDRFIKTGSPFLFVVRAADQAEDFILHGAKAAGIDAVTVIPLDTPTDGQATTAKIAAEHALASNPFAVFNIDTAVAPGILDPTLVRGAGWIPCFDAPGEGWSFVRLGQGGAAVEIREKRRISNHATLGFYWFESAALYRAAYRTYYATGGREEQNERYVAPLYNQLIAEGRSVYIHDVPQQAVTPLGTPQELSAFLADERGVWK